VKVVLWGFIIIVLCFLQDFFETGIFPADTDFRILSSKYGGDLPGVDIAFLLDSGAYHMQQDMPERIKPGTLQVSSSIDHSCMLSALL
jgi:hypothetical protein